MSKIAPLHRPAAMTHRYIEILHSRLCDAAAVYVQPGADREAYLDGLAATIREHSCEPFQVSAEVTAPGFPDADIGTIQSGWCVAHDAGYWLVYQPERDRYCCFWGTDVTALGAPGIYGEPLYCWSA
ncbi:hypothetical protein [Luteibacter sp. UNC138MFCol5.1]|uniref:hypothetical protein n=1 Tax=Luteibacter sp. UNC138MFCol5.1 TaxID=1502774 RepID=UPI0011603FA4|nr:hypothetical protein [Luteibacter sp. UNC138MFCol5.1]